MLHKRIQKEHIVRLQTCDVLYKWVFLTFKKRQKCGGEGGIRTLAPVTPAYSLSRGAPYSHLGTSPQIRSFDAGGESGIRTHGASQHHRFSRPAP